MHAFYIVTQPFKFSRISFGFRNNLLIHHEEQLAQMTSLCKQEMKLLMAIKSDNEVMSPP